MKMKMKRVYRIESTAEEHAQTLYACAEKVFELPSWQKITDWLRGGPAPELPDLEDTPHRGAAIGLLHSHRGIEAAIIETNGGRRVIVSTDLQAVMIEFPLPGSIFAAGELIRHAWRVPYDTWALVTYVDGSKVNLDDYPGPIGLDLYLARRHAVLTKLGYTRFSTTEDILRHAERGGWCLDGYPVTQANLGEFLAVVAE
jgi:hypothetical protein